MKEKEIKKEITENKTTRPRIMRGIVISDKMKDTCTVLVTRFVKHKKYKKYQKINKKYKAHDVNNTKKIGDKVSIKESKPISKDKHFIVI